MRTKNMKVWCLSALLLLPVLTMLAQDVVIRRNTTTTTTSTTTTTVSRKPQDSVVKPPKPKVTTGTLSITSTPTGAVVKIGGKYMGETPLTLEKQKPDTYSVTVSQEGYESQTRSVTVAAGQKATCGVTLKKKQMQQPEPPKPQPVQPVQQPTTTSTTTSSAIQTFTVAGVSFKMVRVEGGTFTMGATAEQGGDAYSDELPTHRVTLSSYCIGETEVTQALWEAVMGNNPSNWKGASLPVEQVSWDDCQNFIRELNRMTGKQFRLPTEAEWEFAARGGNKSTGCKYSGSNAIDKVAWYTDNSGGKTHEVKTKSPNELGIYDMSGNVWEWCQDWKGSYSSSAQSNPTGPSSGSSRVSRGGGWDSSAGGCRVANRNDLAPSYRVYNIGLRLAL